MAKSSKLVATKRGKVLLVKRRKDGLWMFPGGRKLPHEDDKTCLRREIKEELPKLKLGRVTTWKEVRKKNEHSGRKMSDAIFVAKKVSGEARHWRHEGDREGSMAQTASYSSHSDLALHS